MESDKDDTGTPDSPPSVSVGDDADPIVALLKYRHFLHVKAINERDWDTLSGYQWHVADHFTADIMYSRSIKSWTDYVGAFREMTSRVAPDFHISILDINVTITKPRTEADVYLMATEEGRVPGVVSHGMSQLEWKRKDVGGKTEWLLHSHVMLRGATDGVGF